jgi:hypothetical protein
MKLFNWFKKKEKKPCIVIEFDNEDAIVSILNLPNTEAYATTVGKLLFGINNGGLRDFLIDALEEAAPSQDFFDVAAKVWVGLDNQRKIHQQELAKKTSEKPQYNPDRFIYPSEVITRAINRSNDD